MGEFSPEFNTTLDVTVPAASDVDDEERERRKRLPGETEDEYIQRAFTDLMQTLYDRGLLKRPGAGQGINKAKQDFLNQIKSKNPEAKMLVPESFSSENTATASQPNESNISMIQIYMLLFCLSIILVIGGLIVLRLVALHRERKKKKEENEKKKEKKEK